MGDINYEPVIRDMTWSYSRVKSFYDCPYRWYLRYIRKLPAKDMFFASYGTFMHKLIEQYLRAEKTPEQLCDQYLLNFRNEVTGSAPSQKVFASYFADGLAYLKSLRPVPYNVLAVEKRVDFKLDGIPFVGYIDLLAEQDGNLLIIDNKSRNLKPRSKRAKPTKTDLELDEYLRQLYIYAAAIEQETQKLPQKLCFNCFRQNVFIEEDFDPIRYADSKRWLTENVNNICIESDFDPDIEFFKCRYLCEMNEHCEYYALSQGR